MLPLNASASAFRPQTLLVGHFPLFSRSASLLRSRCLTRDLFQYYLSGLSTDTHTITLTNTETNPSIFFDLDRFVVSKYSAVSPPAGSSEPSTSTGGRFAFNVLSFATIADWSSLAFCTRINHSNVAGVITGVTVAAVISIFALVRLLFCLYSAGANVPALRCTVVTNSTS
jgi:hypothetical protein